jgi:hypothetical protein
VLLYHNRTHGSLTCLIQSFFVAENCTYVIDSSLVKCFAVFEVRGVCLLETTKSECKYYFGVIGLVGVGCSWSDGTLHVIMMNQRKKLACVD